MILFVNSGSKIKEFTFKKAKDLGYEVALLNSKLTWQKPYVDYFIKADTYDHLSSIREVLKHSKNINIEGVVTFWERDVELCSKLAYLLGVPGVPLDASVRARNKLKMRQALRSDPRTVDIQPKFYSVETLKDLKEGIKRVGLPCVLKPISGAASKDVVKIEKDDSKFLQTTFSHLFNRVNPQNDPLYNFNPGKFILEEYLSGIEISVEGFVYKGIGEVVGILDKIPMVEPYFIECGDFSPSNLEERLQEEIRDLILNTVEVLGYDNCGFHGEVKITNEGPKLVEIAARLGGDYINDFLEAAYDYDLTSNILRVVSGREPKELKPIPNVYIGGKYFLPDKNGSFVKIEGIEKLQNDKSLSDVRLLVKKDEYVKIPPFGYDYLGWVVAKGKSREEVDKKINTAINSCNVIINGDIELDSKNSSSDEVSFQV
jgi:biotin carboxylase